jgi:hypothetical protein
MRRDRSQKMESSGQVEAANKVHAVATDKRGVTRSQPFLAWRKASCLELFQSPANTNCARKPRKREDRQNQPDETNTERDQHDHDE